MELNIIFQINVCVCVCGVFGTINTDNTPQCSLRFDSIIPCITTHVISPTEKTFLHGFITFQSETFIMSSQKNTKLQI